MGHMHANLVRTTCFQPTFHQGNHFRRTKALNRTGAGHSVTAPLKQHRLALAICLVTGQLCGHAKDIAGFKACAFNSSQPWIIRIRHTVNQSFIVTFSAVVCKLSCQTMVRRVRFGRD